MPITQIEFVEKVVGFIGESFQNLINHGLPNNQDTHDQLKAAVRRFINGLDHETRGLYTEYELEVLTFPFETQRLRVVAKFTNQISGHTFQISQEP